MSDIPDSFFRGKKVLLTGHTGFKGSWLSEWLLLLGAEVYGVSLAPDQRYSLFERLRLGNRLTHREIDIRSRNALSDAVRGADPDIVFHLAAQPLVRESYATPVETYETNVMGTVNLLDALREIKKPCAAILITTDKCYENREWIYAYRENDPMGGYDPYSSSKGCAELAIASFRRSFFNPKNGRINCAVASARAGNVIGGGDMAADRIVPDCVRALESGRTIVVRNPRSTRPWQHVLEPLRGYLAISRRLYELVSSERQDPDALEDYSSAFNFGPSPDSNKSVGCLVEEILKNWPGKYEAVPETGAPHEAGLLNLATDKAYHYLGWRPAWNFETTVAQTIAWYKAEHDGVSGDKLRAFTDSQILAYSDAAEQPSK
jgi:CDP-glucose 4,6-dehydratase